MISSGISMGIVTISDFGVVGVLQRFAFETFEPFRVGCGQMKAGRSRAQLPRGYRLRISAAPRGDTVLMSGPEETHFGCTVAESVQVRV